MKKKLLVGLLFIALGYLVLVALHFLYLELGGGYAEYEMQKQVMRPDIDFSAGVKNYASLTVNLPEAPGIQTVEQKYEKIASLQSTTTQFDADEQKTRAAVKAHEALIQEEITNSDNNRRWLRLVIGVPPGHFDDIIADLKKIGKVDTYQVTKTDKTNDYLELKAKRTTLEKTRDALVDLKKQGGKIDELVKLEQEILDVEGKIQELGVQLGQFDKVNEFCTVRFSLSEKGDVTARSPHFGYFIQSLEWASTVYLVLLGVVFVGLLSVTLVLVIMEKAKIFRPGP